MFVIPTVGAALFDISLQANLPKSTLRIFIASLIIGTAGSLASLSRGFLIFMTMPILASLFMIYWSDIAKRKMFYIFSPIALMFFISVPVLVTNLRADIFAGENVLFIKRAVPVVSTHPVVPAPDPESGLNIGQSGLMLLGLTTDRIGGIRQLMAAVSAGVNDLYAPWAIFISDDKYLDQLHSKIYGFAFKSDVNIIAGDDYNCFGGLALSGSYPLVFFGMLFVFFLVLAAEELFRNAGTPTAVLSTLSMVALIVWNNVYVFILWRSALVLVLVYYIVKIIRNSLLSDHIIAETPIKNAKSE
jgi:hypothetical protein